MVAPEDCDNRHKGWWERLALLQYSTLRTTNAARSLGGLPAVESQRALLQAAFEGAKGCQTAGRHPRARRIEQPMERHGLKHKGRQQLPGARQPRLHPRPPRLHWVPLRQRTSRPRLAFGTTSTFSSSLDPACSRFPPASPLGGCFLFLFILWPRRSSHPLRGRAVRPGRWVLGPLWRGACGPLPGDRGPGWVS